MLDLSQLDSKLAASGEEIYGYPRTIDGMKFYLHPLSSRRVLAKIAAIPDSDDLWHEEKRKAFLLTRLPELLAVMVTGWEGVHLLTGEAVPWSEGNAKALFTMHEKLADKVWAKISELGETLEQSLEEDSETLGKSSAGSGSGAAIQSISKG